MDVYTYMYMDMYMYMYVYIHIDGINGANISAASATRSADITASTIYVYVSVHVDEWVT